MSYNHEPFSACLAGKLTDRKIIDVSKRTYESGKEMKK